MLMIELMVLFKNMNFLILLHPHPHSPHIEGLDPGIYIFKKNYFPKFLRKTTVNGEILLKEYCSQIYRLIINYR